MSVQSRSACPADAAKAVPTTERFLATVDLVVLPFD